MHKRLVSFVLIVILGWPLATSAKQPYDSIRLLQDKHEDWKDGDALHGFCTTWAAKLPNRDRVIWVTAAHCLEEVNPEEVYIDGKKAHILKIDVEHDLAALEGPGAEGLYVGFGDTPAMGTPIFIIGYPGGIGPFLTQGYIAAPQVRMPEEPVETSGYDIAVFGGNSGSPVMIKGGIVVGVLQSGWSPYATPICFGATLKNLRLFLNLEA